MADRTDFADFTRLDPSDPLSSDNYGIQNRNPTLLDYYLRLVWEGARDGHDAMADPVDVLTAEIDAEGGQIPSDLTLSVSYTLLDGDGGETALAPLTIVATPAGLAAPEDSPVLAHDALAGTLLANTYAYAVTLADGSGGETALGPPAVVTIPGGSPTNQITVSGLSAFISAPQEWRLWRSIGGEEFHLIAQGTGDVLVDDGSLTADCGVAPPSVTGTTNSTAQLRVTVPSGQPAEAVQFRTYVAIDGDFGGPSLLGTYPIADFDTEKVYTELAFLGNVPPEQSTTMPAVPGGGGSGLAVVATNGDLPVAGSSPGDSYLVVDEGRIYYWDDATSEWTGLFDEAPLPVIHDEGVELGLGGILDFLGAGVTVEQDPLNTQRFQVTIPGGGGLSAVTSSADLPASGDSGDSFLVLDEGRIYFWDLAGPGWVALSDAVSYPNVVDDGEMMGTAAWLEFVGAGVDVSINPDTTRHEIAIPGAQTGHVFAAFGDSRVNPSNDHTKNMEARWTSRLARTLHMQLRNFGVGGSTIPGESTDQPLPRMLAYIMGANGPGPGYDYTVDETSRRPPPALVTLFDAYNTLWKWDLSLNPNFWATVDNCYETFCRLARSDYVFVVGSGIAAPHWTFPAGWNVGALNSGYGVGPVTRVEANGAGSFTFNPNVLGGGSWPGGDLTVIVRARDDIDDTPIWQCRIRAKIGAGPYIATYDSTGGTAGLPALGLDGGAAFTSFTVPIPAGTTDLVTFDVDNIVGQCTIMGAALEIGDKADWPSPLVALALQPHLIASPNGSHPQITNALVDLLNDKLNEVAARFTDGRVITVDLPSIIDGQAPGGLKWFKDDVHHSNLGNAVIAAEFARRIGEVGLSPSHSGAEKTTSGAPTWVSYPGDSVWDRTARHWWHALDDPALALANDNRKVWTADSIRRIPTSAMTPPVAGKLGLLLMQSAKAALPAALTPYGVRIEAERDGDLRHIGFNVGSLSGSVEVLVYDTGDAQGGAIGTRTLLWASGPQLMSGMTGGQWNTIDPGVGIVPVKAGQHLDIMIASSDTGSTFLRVSVGGNSLTIPTTHLPVPGGAAPKLGFKYPALTDLLAATATAAGPVTAGNVVGQDILPYLSAVIL